MNKEIICDCCGGTNIYKRAFCLIYVNTGTTELLKKGYDEYNTYDPDELICEDCAFSFDEDYVKEMGGRK